MNIPILITKRPRLHPIPTTDSIRFSATDLAMKAETTVDVEEVNGEVVAATVAMDVAEDVVVAVPALPNVDAAMRSRRASFDVQWVDAQPTPYPAPLDGDCTPGHGGVYQDVYQLRWTER